MLGVSALSGFSQGTLPAALDWLQCLARSRGVTSLTAGSAGLRHSQNGSASNAKCVSNTAFDNGKDVERRGILVPCRRLCSEGVCKTWICCRGLAVDALDCADLPGQVEGHHWSIDESDARLEGEGKVLLWARNHPSVTGRKQEAPST